MLWLSLRAQRSNLVGQCAPGSRLLRRSAPRNDRASMDPYHPDLVSGDRKGIAAAAGRGRVRVADLERRPHQILDEIDFGAVEQTERNLVDDDDNPVFFEQHVVLVTLRVEREAVLEPGAAAARDGDAQKDVRVPLLFLQYGDATRGVAGQDDPPLRNLAFGHVLVPRLYFHAQFRDRPPLVKPPLGPALRPPRLSGGWPVPGSRCRSDCRSDRDGRPPARRFSRASAPAAGSS